MHLHIVCGGYAPQCRVESGVAMTETYGVQSLKQLSGPVQKNLAKPCLKDHLVAFILMIYRQTISSNSGP